MASSSLTSPPAQPPLSPPPREPMRNVDKAWLDMDTPTNLMIINGVMLFDAPIAYARFHALIQDRLVARYPRFRQRIVNRPGPGGLAWEVDPHFDLRCHLRHIALPAPGDEAALQALVSDLISEALEPRRPLWRFYLIDNVNGGCAFFGRLHHCIADGIALVQVLLSLTDDHPDAAAPAPAAAPASSPAAPRTAPAPNPARGALRTPAAATLGLARGVLEGASRFVKATADRSLHEGLQTVTNPRSVLEKAYAAGLISLTGAAILAKLLVLPADNDSVFKGNLGAHKRVVWSNPVPLAQVKAIGAATGATINDVLVTAVAGALRRYMEQHGGAVDIRAMVPVNLRPANQPLTTLGNEFALVYLTLPLQAESPALRLRAVKRQMDMLKQSPEPLLIYEILNIIGMAPGELADYATHWFSGKASAVLTNVPGPRAPLYLCGQPLRRILFWVPQSGRIGLGISIISYCGEVSLGVMIDEALISEPAHILAAFDDELAALAHVGPRTHTAPAAHPAHLANGGPTPNPP